MTLALGQLVSQVVEEVRPTLRARGASPAKHIALAVPMGVGGFHELLRGVVDWVSRNGNWAITTFSGTGEDAIPDWSDWHGDGVIAALRCERDETALAGRGLSCVNVNGAFLTREVPLVALDDDASGRMAADHLLAGGFRHFAFYGLRGSPCSSARYEGFARRLQARGVAADHICATLTGSQVPASEDAEMMALSAWLGRAEPPVAIFAANTRLAERMLRACRAVRLRVPDQVAVLGVDDDLSRAVVPERGETPECSVVSSITCDWWRIGYDAAASLHRLMQDGAATVQDRLIPPAGLMKRASTDVVLVEDRSVSKAVEYVRAHISEVFGVEALLRVTRAPRRSLELEFKRTMGCTPYQFIARARVARAQELLSDPRPAKLTAIAAACGFADLRRFRLVFRRETGMSPAQYRAAQPLN